MEEKTHALSIDIGGTFTDFSLLDLGSGQITIHKLLTNALEPDQTLIQGASEVLAQSGVEFSALSVIIHSTTLVTNAIIERKGSKSALLTTRGFRDVLEMGREQIYHMYDLQARPAEPIVPRYLRREINERTTRDGTVLQAPDVEEATEIVADLVADGVESLAVSLLHSYRNPESEQALKAAIASRFPALSLSISSEVAPVINEFERTSTTVADCYVKPTVSRYLTEVEGLLSEAGYLGKLLVMHSAGGVMDSEKARQHPVRLIESGPAAGALAAVFYGGLLGQNDLISLDMGGTTAKTCLIEGGGLTLSNNIEVARVHRFLKGSGLPIVIPVVDLVEIGAGGGSIAWTDQMRLLKVGPRSAGANPGPACYGMGGDEPTVTDADLALGYLDPEYFLGGRMKLDKDAGLRAIATLANEIGMEDHQVAAGIHEVVNENMAASARIHIIERNKDPRNYSMIAFGGAGPSHACGVARILGVKKVIVPLAAGVTSTVGCLAAPISFEEVRSLPDLLEDTDWVAVERLFTEMEASGVAMLREAGLDPGSMELVRSADLRLVGQIHELNVTLPDWPLGDANVGHLEDRFHELYQSLYSRRNLNIPVQVQNWRLLVRVPQPEVRLQVQSPSGDADPKGALKGRRKAYFKDSGGFVDCAVYDRYRLRAGHRIEGPAIIEEQESTAVVGPNDAAEVDGFLNLVIDIG
ncbi:MAG: hydantoinase/oxoprolinase family protein [Chloroflexi bacterium]|nr:hydantoinase/oxoprolinase family protein [Chloroflexota bacterium]